MEKILTIVIPTYNMEDYLDRCLRSLVLSSNMDKLEVLIINDGSKDNSLQIARKYEAMYPETFIAIDKENGNYGSCINCGLKHATGRYLKVLDADDIFDTGNLEEYISFLMPLHVDLIMSDLLIVDQKEDIFTEIEYDLPVGIEFSFSYFAQKNVPYMWMHAVTHLTEKMRSIKYHQQEGISYTDKEFVFYPMAVSKTVAYFPKIIYHYFTGRNGQTVDPKIWVKNYWMEEQAIKKLITLYHEHKTEVAPEGREFMRLQAKLYIHSIYREYLRSSRNILPIKNLIEFDEWLKEEDEELYHCADDEMETAQFCFIPAWRRYRSRMKSYLSYRFIHRIVFFCTKRHI